MFLICVIHKLYVKNGYGYHSGFFFFLNASTLGFSPLYWVCGVWGSLL